MDQCKRVFYPDWQTRKNTLLQRYRISICTVSSKLHNRGGIVNYFLDAWTKLLNFSRYNLRANTTPYNGNKTNNKFPVENQVNAGPSSKKAIGPGRGEKYQAMRSAIHFWLRRSDKKPSYPQIVYLLILGNNCVEFIISHVFRLTTCCGSFLFSFFFFFRESFSSFSSQIARNIRSICEMNGLF